MALYQSAVLGVTAVSWVDLFAVDNGILFTHSQSYAEVSLTSIVVYKLILISFSLWFFVLVWFSW